MGDRANAIGKVYAYRGLGLRTNSLQNERGEYTEAQDDGGLFVIIHALVFKFGYPH